MSDMDDTAQNNSPEEAELIFRIEQESIDATNAWDLRPEILRALYTQGPDLWVDLARVSFIDSTGLGMLVSVLQEARDMQGSVHLINASREVRRVLQVTGLELLFEQPITAAST